MERIGEADQNSMMSMVHNCGHGVLYSGITRDGNFRQCVKLFVDKFSSSYNVQDVQVPV